MVNPISLDCIVLHQRQPRGEGYIVECLMTCGPNQSISAAAFLNKINRVGLSFPICTQRIVLTSQENKGITSKLTVQLNV